MNRSLAALLLLAAAPAPAAAEWRTHVVKSQAQWEELRRAHPEALGGKSVSVDFDKKILAVIVYTAPTTAHALTVTVQDDPLDRSRVNIFYGVTPPRGLAATMMSYPHAVVTLPKTYRSVHFEPERRVSAPPPAERPALGEETDRRVRALLPDSPAFDGR